MPRLLIVSRSHNPLGGADRIIADLCRELPSRGWDTVLGLTRGAQFNDPDMYRRVHQNLPTVDIDGTAGARSARLDSLREVLSSTRPDLVLSMRVFDAYEAVARLKARNFSLAPRLAVGVRAFESPYISDVRRCQANIDLCVTSGNLIAHACRRIGGMEDERVTSIGGGVHSPLKTEKPREAKSPIRLLYAGRLEQHQKRVLDLVPFTQALLAEGIDFRLDICGAGPEEEKLASMLKPQVDRGQVMMHGWVDQADLYDRFFPKADCFIHFAAWEGVTIAPREAMAHGVVPVISEFIGLHSEGQFQHDVNALTFPVGRPEIACQRIGELVSKPGLLTRLSKAAMDSQTGKYSYAGALDAWRNALDHCISLPAKIGQFPSVPEQLDGRLTRWGVPNRTQRWLRAAFNRPVRHQSPGSEWPTASGLMSTNEQAEIEAFAEAFEAEKKLESAA